MDEKKVLERLQRQCVRSEQCTADVRRKALKALEGDSEAAERVLKALVKDRFVDDGRYSAAYAREKASLQGWGPVKIRFMLRGKGISDSLIDAALGEIDREKAEDKLQRLVSARYRQLEGDPQWKLKLMKYALGRGYAYEDVAEAIVRCQPRG